jgi:hypothetical protein
MLAFISAACSGVIAPFSAVDRRNASTATSSAAYGSGSAFGETLHLVRHADQRLPDIVSPNAGLYP